MIIKTGAWSAAIPPGHIKVGISRGAPRGAPAGYRLYRKLAPGDWFKSAPPYVYLGKYNLQLARLDPVAAKPTAIAISRRNGSRIACRSPSKRSARRRWRSTASAISPSWASPGRNISDHPPPRRRQMTIVLDETSTRIAQLNDAFRQSVPSPYHTTRGVVARGAGFVAEACVKVARFDAFTEDNDPWGEHDFGSFDVQGEKLFWKIDYYDQELKHGSEDPADPAVTRRVLTIMMADEY
jgi:hypothetical protein